MHKKFIYRATLTDINGSNSVEKKVEVLCLPEFAGLLLSRSNLVSKVPSSPSGGAEKLVVFFKRY